MTRMTKKSERGNGLWAEKDYCDEMIDFCQCYDGCEGFPVSRVLDRLCKYEETGFEPKDIMKMYRVALINAYEIVEKVEQKNNNEQVISGYKVILQSEKATLGYNPNAAEKYVVWLKIRNEMVTGCYTNSIIKAAEKYVERNGKEGVENEN